MKRIGFYGGSFDPPHAGHQATILNAITTGQLDELIIVPVFSHPYGKKLTPYQHRLEMCDRLRDPFHPNIHKITVSRIEEESFLLNGNGLTVNAVNLLMKKEYQDTGERPHVVLILGTDCRDDLPNWEGYDQLMELCKRGWLSFFFVDRIKGLSSTSVRAALRSGGYVDRWLPRSIHRYILEHGLYAPEDSL